MTKWIALTVGVLLLAGVGIPVMMVMAMATMIGGAQQQVSSANASLCSASWQGDGITERDLTSQQLDAAATIYAAALDSGLGAAAAIVGIATAAQESNLGADPRTLTPNGDGDVGLFQQRSLVGWYANGATQADNVAILNDHAYAARTFFLGHDTTTGYHIPGLADIDGWQDMPVTQAAQAVQRSAFPDAYAKHEALARALVQRLAGGAAGQILCAGSIGGSLDCPATGMRTEAGLQPDALRGLRCIKQNWPQITVIGGTRNDPDSDHHVGNAIDPMIPDYLSPAGIALGTDIAEWARTNAEGLGVTYIIWRKKLWSTGRADEGWRTCGVTASCYSGTDPSAAHLDHVHISFHGAMGTGNPAASTSSTVGGISLPIDRGSYRLTARYNQAGKAWASGFHTGLDFAAPEGTLLRSITAGTVTTTAWHSAYGNLTQITADDGTVFFYAHQHSRTIHQGQRVTAGQPIGTVGNTGNSYGAHLHLEVRIGGRTVDPETWLSTRGLTP